MNEPTKTEVPAEEWLKATSIELCKVADYFLALRQNTMEVVSAATKVNIDSIRLEGENVDLKARVKRLEEAGDGIVKLANDYTVLLKAFQHTEMMEDAIDQIERWDEAKESKP
jgi:hypothetical protein